MGARSWENSGLMPSWWASAAFREKFLDSDLSAIYIITLREVPIFVQYDLKTELKFQFRYGNVELMIG